MCISIHWKVKTVYNVQYIYSTYRSMVCSNYVVHRSWGSEVLQIACEWSVWRLVWGHLYHSGASNTKHRTIYIYIYTYMQYFTRTKVVSRPLFQNKAMYICLRQWYDSEGHFAWPAWWIEFTSRFILKSFKGYECDPWSTTQVETSQV